MNWPEPTRLVSRLALPVVTAILACGRAQPPSALAAARSAPAGSAAPTSAIEASEPTALATAPAAPSSTPSPSSPPAVTSAAPANPPPAITSVLVLGDSLTDEKVGGGGFVQMLREHCPKAVFDNRAKGGFMVNQMRRRLETEVLPAGVHYSHAIVFGGVNDLYSDQTAKRTLARIESDLTRIYNDLKARSTDVVAITVTPWGGFKRWFTPERGENTLLLNDWILAQPAAGSIWTAVDAYPLLSCGDPERLCPDVTLPFKDGLHFGKPGHQKLAEALLKGPFRGCAER